MIYGYCRISRKQQSIERQERNIKAMFPEALIIKEAFSGTSMNRPEWNKLYNRVKDGDSIIFDSVSRMSRNAAEGFMIYQTLYERKVSLIFLKEPHINTDIYREVLSIKIPEFGDKVDTIIRGINEYLMLLAKEHIRIAFSQAEKEVIDLRQRTSEGIETARLNGKQIGQTPGRKLIVKKERPTKEAILKYSRTFGGNLSDVDCIKLIGVSRNTYYKYKRELSIYQIHKK